MSFAAMDWPTVKDNEIKLTKLRGIGGEHVDLNYLARGHPECQQLIYISNARTATAIGIKYRHCPSGSGGLAPARIAANQCLQAWVSNGHFSLSIRRGTGWQIKPFALGWCEAARKQCFCVIYQLLSSFLHPKTRNVANEAGTKVKAKVDRGTSLLSEAQAELELETSARQFEERFRKIEARNETEGRGALLGSLEYGP